MARTESGGGLLSSMSPRSNAVEAVPYRLNSRVCFDTSKSMDQEVLWAEQDVVAVRLVARVELVVEARRVLILFRSRSQQHNIMILTRTRYE